MVKPVSRLSVPLPLLLPLLLVLLLVLLLLLLFFRSLLLRIFFPEDPDQRVGAGRRRNCCCLDTSEYDPINFTMHPAVEFFKLIDSVAFFSSISQLGSLSDRRGLTLMTSYLMTLGFLSSFTGFLLSHGIIIRTFLELQLDQKRIEITDRVSVHRVGVFIGFRRLYPKISRFSQVFLGLGFFSQVVEFFECFWRWHLETAVLILHPFDAT